MNLKNFSNFNLNEEDDSYIQSLLNKISDLEDENKRLKDEILDWEDDLDEKEMGFLRLEDDYNDLSDRVTGLEKEIKRYEDLESDWEHEKNVLENKISSYEDPENTFKSGSEEEKKDIVEIFPRMISLMEAYPIEFGSLIREKNLVMFKRLYYYYLNNEWLNAYTGKGGSALNKFGIKD